MMSYINQRGHALRIAFGITVLAFSLLAGIGMVQAETELPNVPHESGFSDSLQMPGWLEATGTHFELTNSNYLDITLDSTEPVNLTLESAPEMVTIHLAPASDATSTQITLSGFAPQTTYHKYEDNYHNHTAFTTDANGKYSYKQDLSRPHAVFIQPRRSTRFINDNATGGDCTSIGTWDAATKTCTLTTDLTETIQIDSNNITLNGGGHTITGASTGSGIYLDRKTGITIKNVNVRKFYYGIYLADDSNKNDLIDNTASNNSNIGIFLQFSSNNNLNGNTASNNSYGIGLSDSSGNNLTGNTVSNNSGSGITLYYSMYNYLTDNTASTNLYGIRITSSSNRNYLIGNIASNSPGNGIVLMEVADNNLTGNTVSNNNNSGIALANSANNNLSGNTISNNSIGINLFYSSNNNIFNNYFSNTNNAYDNHTELSSPGNNTWNITKTKGKNIIGGFWLGGNFWSDYAGKDTDGDSLGNTLLPYNNSGNITNSGDYLPLTQVGVVGGIIQGTVHNDANSNKIRDEGEIGLANWKIQLRGHDSLTRTPVNRETVTDGNGYYIFTNLNPGNYAVREKPQSRWVQTTPSAISVRLGEGESAVVDFGNRRR